MTDEHKERFTYRFEKVEYRQDTDLPRQCSSCDKWGKAWRFGNRTCKEDGYSLDDICAQFEYKKIPVVNETIVKTFKQVGSDWTVFARGDVSKIEELFGEDFEIDDQRSAPKLGFKLKCLTKLFPWQLEVGEAWLEQGYGIVQAPTAWGKTVLWAWLISKLGLRTLLLAQEVRHLSVGWEGLYEHTNLAEIEEKLGTHLCGQVNHDWRWAKEKDGTKVRKLFKKPGAYYPITFATYQSFGSARGRELKKELKDYFGVVWCEEAHHESAATYHQVTKSFNAFYRGGQSATPSRKDQTEVAIFDTLGPVTARGHKEAMTPLVRFVESKVLVPPSMFKGKYAIPRVNSFLARNKTYIECVSEKIIEDIENGRKVLLITERKKLGFAVQKRVEALGYKVALVMAQVKMERQDWYARQYMLGQLHLIVGTSVMDENVNIPPIDSVHLPFPNFTKEREEQRVGRARRYLSPGNLKFMEENKIVWEKPQPLVTIYTWHAGNSLAVAAVKFRESLYKKWKFDFEVPLDQPQKAYKRPKTMKDWLKAEEEGEDTKL